MSLKFYYGIPTSTRGTLCVGAQLIGWEQLAAVKADEAHLMAVTEKTFQYFHLGSCSLFRKAGKRLEIIQQMAVADISQRHVYSYIS